MKYKKHQISGKKVSRKLKEKEPVLKILTRLPQPVLSYCILHLHVVYSVFSDEALATALYADIHALDYAVLTSSKQTTVFKSAINGIFLLSFIQHCLIM
jgi:hypothetical protein